jgi:hypothetical protein
MIRKTARRFSEMIVLKHQPQNAMAIRAQATDGQGKP